jgi:hypothetical protein
MKSTALLPGAESLRRASAEGIAQRASAGGAAVVDHGSSRPEAVAQRRLEGLANQSAQAKSTAAHQALLNGAPSVAALHQRKQAMGNESPVGTGAVQLKPVKEEKKPAQRKSSEDEKKKKPAQRKVPEEDKRLQRKPAGGEGPVQLETGSERKPNDTGLPDQLKTGIESLSGVSMDGVKVHYNSPRPAQLQALAFTQGSDIHVAPGQERHVPHEAWHAVQQRQGRVPTTAQLKGVALNDNPALEAEADVMGARANQ